MFIDGINTLIGTPPTGMEWLSYMIASIILLWTCKRLLTIATDFYAKIVNPKSNMKGGI